MASCKELRDPLVTCYDSKITSDEEFLTLNDLFQSENPDFDYESYPAFDLAEMSIADCFAEFRFEKQDIPRLSHALQLPPTFRSTSLISLLYPCTVSLKAK